jgi:hypothetical protein
MTIIAAPQTRQATGNRKDRSAGGPSAQSQPWKKDVRKQFRRPSFGRFNHSPRVRPIEAGLATPAGKALTHGFQYAG